MNSSEEHGKPTPRRQSSRRIQHALGGFAFACFLFAAIAFGAAVAAPWWARDFAEITRSPFAGVYVLFGLLWCSGFLAALAIILGALSLKSLAGKIAALGGFLVFLGMLGWYHWNG